MAAQHQAAETAIEAERRRIASALGDLWNEHSGCHDPEGYKDLVYELEAIYPAIMAGVYSADGPWSTLLPPELDPPEGWERIAPGSMYVRLVHKRAL